MGLGGMFFGSWIVNSLIGVNWLGCFIFCCVVY